ncbi:MAG TPA: S8 family serine peptidase [Bradyrhizobium sp.]|nr:S8 family serine peptidase [Bradyrhizobium sp.]
MRSPNLNIQARIPTINPTVVPRIDPNIAGRMTPNLRTYPACSYAYRNSDGECSSKPVLSTDGGGTAGTGGSGGASGKNKDKNKNSGPRRIVAQTVLNQRTITGEIVAEIDSSLSVTQTDELARRHGLARLQSQNFPLIGATIGLFRITDRRSAQTVSRELATEASIRSVQLNFRHFLQEQEAALTEGDPAQYALAKLRLPQAHTLARGANVTVAVIDSGVDVKHPELANAIADSFDALGSKEGPHVHGTGIAGAIVSHARLMGSAPAARILAIRAFAAAPNGGESTSYVILKALDYAAAHGAQIVNMSFAGPNDALIERGISAAVAKGIVMVAAAGNAGAKSPPLYPAANRSVIAVSATDSQDRLFAASNRGGHIAVSAPGVDIFLPAPDEKYQMTSGTSFSAAYVSGLAALLLERNPALKPDEVRAILMKTARDLGAPGRDDLFGAGEADAYAAVSAVAPAPATPVATVSDRPAGEVVPDRPDAPPTRALNQPPAAMASDKSVVGGAVRPAAQ